MAQLLMYIKVVKAGKEDFLGEVLGVEVEVQEVGAVVMADQLLWFHQNHLGCGNGY